jgi:signal transduction histidine kinase
MLDLSTATTDPMLDEQAWVRGRMLRALIRAGRSTQLVSLLVVGLVVAVLLPYVARWELLAWVVLAVSMAGLRRWSVSQYFKRGLAYAHINEVEQFFDRHWLVWPLSAVAWGLSTVLHFDDVPLTAQFVSWLILAGVGMFGMYGFSADLRTLRWFVGALMLTAITVLLWRMGVQLQFQGPLYHFWMLFGLVAFWQLLIQAGVRLNANLRSNFELEYRNKQLIASLTEQTQAALQAIEVKNRFLSSAAHDIRQPVHALGLYADWLRSEPELAREIAPKIVECTKAVNALFDSLFDLSRLEIGKIELSIKPVPLQPLLEELDASYRPLAQAKGLQFRLHSQPGVAVSDPILLRRIVGNLVGNAIKYTEKGGVMLALRTQGGYPCIQVWDTGVGIAAEHQDEVFSEFFKVPLHEGTQDGFGLGLYIVARLAQILNHPVSLYSRLGRGTVFRVLLKPADPSQVPGYADHSAL